MKVAIPHRQDGLEELSDGDCWRDYDERRTAPQRDHRARVRGGRVYAVLRGNPGAKADHVFDVRLRVRLRGWARRHSLKPPALSHLPVAAPRRQKKAGLSVAGPAHEPGGGGGDPQAHSQSLSAARRRATVRTRCLRWMFPLLTRCPLFRQEHWVLNSLRARPYAEMAPRGATLRLRGKSGGQ